MTGTTPRPKPELVEKLGELAREAGSTPEELEAAAREYAEYERWKAAMIQEALDDEAAGDRGRPAEDVFAEVEALLDGNPTAKAAGEKVLPTFSFEVVEEVTRKWASYGLPGSGKAIWEQTGSGR